MKVVQLNIHWGEHREHTLPFLLAEQADLICLQEVCESDLEELGERLGMRYVFAPMTLVPIPSLPSRAPVPSGVALFTRIPLEDVEVRWYFGDAQHTPVHHKEDRNSVYKPLLSGRLNIGGVSLVVGTTHFMKSGAGAPDEYQRARMEQFLPALDELQPDVLCGDFNIPRGTELYDVLAKRMRDAIPPQYTNSLDPNLHRVPGLRYMIDYVWASPRVHIMSVRQVCGVSDHCAFVAEMSHLIGN